MPSDDAVAAARARLAARSEPSFAASTAKATPAQKAAPTKEVGIPGSINIGGIGGMGGAPGWGYFADDREYAPELQWPESTAKFERMETDAQLKGLLLATTSPIRRFRWELDPNEADPAIVEHVAESLNLPIRGEDPRPPRGGFNHDKHMGHALRALSQGHYHFERVYELRDDGLLHLKKLGTRPPGSIVGIRTDEHGDLVAIEQLATGGYSGGQVFGGFAGWGTRVLETPRLLTYLWDTADDGDQVGRSMLRACYRDWIVKDALIRVDAVKHERNAMGIPWFEVDANATKPQIESLARKAEEIRASTVGGGAGPGRLRVAGVEGTLPDTIGSIRYHDEQMSKAFMLLFFNLGGDTKFGSKALGNSFMEWYTGLQDTIADWYAQCTQAQIDDEVKVNWGLDVQTPLLAYTRVESAEVSFEDLALGVEKGLIATDPELRAYIQERFKLPGQADYVAPEPAPAPAPTEDPPAPDPVKATAPRRGALAETMLAALDGERLTWPALARAVDSDPKNGTARRARDLLLSEGAILKRTDGTLAIPVALALPDRDLKRQPLAFETAAHVDFAAMEAAFLDTRAALVDAYKEAQAAQITQLAAEVEEADGDAAKLARLECDPVDVDLIYDRLLEAAEAGVASARQEHTDQTAGASAASLAAAADVTVDQSALDKTVRERAEAASLTLAAGLDASASKKAASLSTLAPADAASAVTDHLNSLTDAALNEQLGGATHQAYNGGRRSYMAASAPKEVWASEILDGNACAQCNSIDGTEWPTLAEAEVAYPVGGYVECEGGLRCRGTLVAVY